MLEDETTGNGTLLCLKEGLRADAAFIIDGTRLNRAINQHAGNLEFGLVMKGKPASVGVSHVGVNAAEMLARPTSLHLREIVFALNKDRSDLWMQFPSPFQISCRRSERRPATHGSRLGECAVLCDLPPPPFTLATMREFLTESAETFSCDVGP